MSGFRSRLRLLAATWLVIQVASLAALVSLDCCAEHRPARQELPCHQAVPEPQHDTDDCRMSGTCDGPLATLVALLSNCGPLPDRIAMSPALDLNAPVPIAVQHAANPTAPPDYRPPRA
jgi:hypothetical protein